MDMWNSYDKYPLYYFKIYSGVNENKTQTLVMIKSTKDVCFKTMEQALLKRYELYMLTHKNPTIICSSRQF